MSVNEKGELSSAQPEPTENVVTWVYEEGSFVPSAKLVGKEKYSIVSNYLGTPESAYDSQGNKVWSCELDIYGKIKHLKGDAHFVPFRYQGQYHDTEIDLYYNRFRYYSPESGMYISQDPIRLKGNNPNIYAYVKNSITDIDPFGLMAWGPLDWKGMGHHIIPRKIAEVLNIPELATEDAFAWYPMNPDAHPDIHLQMHQDLKANEVPWRGGTYSENLAHFIEKAKEVYRNYNINGILKFRGVNGDVVKRNVTPLQALEEIEKMIKNNNIPCK